MPCASYGKKGLDETKGVQGTAVLRSLPVCHYYYYYFLLLLLLLLLS